MERQRLLAVGASLTLLIGTFAPVLNAPVFGSVNYFRNGEGDGTVIILLATVSLVLALRRRYEWLFATGACVLAVLAASFIRFRSAMSDIRASMDRDLADNPFRGLAEAAVGNFQIEWGWAVLVMGGALLIVAALMTPDAASALRPCPFCAEKIQLDARLCRYCQQPVEPVGTVAASQRARVPLRVIVTTVLLLVVVPLLLWYLSLALPILMSDIGT